MPSAAAVRQTSACAPCLYLLFFFFRSLLHLFSFEFSFSSWAGPCRDKPRPRASLSRPRPQRRGRRSPLSRATLCASPRWNFQRERDFILCVFPRFNPCTRSGPLVRRCKRPVKNARSLQLTVVEGKRAHDYFHFLRESVHFALNGSALCVST